MRLCLLVPVFSHFSITVTCVRYRHWNTQTDRCTTMAYTVQSIAHVVKIHSIEHLLDFKKYVMSCYNTCELSNPLVGSLRFGICMSCPVTYITAVPDAMHVCFIIIQYFLVDQDLSQWFVQYIMLFSSQLNLVSIYWCRPVSITLVSVSVCQFIHIQICSQFWSSQP